MPWVHLYQYKYLQPLFLRSPLAYDHTKEPMFVRHHPMVVPTL